MIVVRPMQDPAEGLALCPEAEAVRRAFDEDPTGVLLALEQGAPLALLRGTIIEQGYRILDVSGPADGLGRVVPAFVAFLLGRFPGQRIEARIDAAPHTRALHDALLEAGAEPVLAQIHYGRDLTGAALEAELAAHPRSAAPLEYKRYAEVGKAGLVDILGAIFAGGAAGRVTADPLRELDQMLFEATPLEGGLDHWWVIHRGEELVGVALALVAPADTGAAPADTGAAPAPAWGCLQYLGLVPALRGQGLGARLHLEVLHRLAQAGVRRYEDATAIDNVAMRHIFEKNGCAPLGSSRAYVLRWERDQGHLDDFAALLDYLQAERYAIEVCDTRPPWVRAPMRFGREEALVTLSWLEDARLLQVLHEFPLHVGPSSQGQVALAAAALNASLGVPGFQLDAATGTLAFRLPVHLDEHGGLAVHLLRRALATVVHTAARYASYLRAQVGDAGPGPLDKASLGEIFAHLL